MLKIKAVLLAGMVAVPGILPAEHEVAEPVPGLLLHASFDRDRFEHTEPIVHPHRLHGHALPGKPGCFPHADYARGNPIPSNLDLIEIVDEGAYGEAAYVPVNGIFTFEAFNNVLAAQGTVAFWFKPADPLFTHPYRGGDHPKIITVTDGSALARSRPLLDIGVNGPRRELRVTGLGSVEPTYEWNSDKWVHLVYAWDQTAGVRLYEDGKLLTENERRAYRFPSLDKINLGSWVYIAWRTGARRMGLFYDELHIFDYPLNADQVLKLYETNQAPRNPVNRMPDTQADQVDRQAWADEAFGAGDVAIPALEAGAVVKLRKLPVKRVLSHYTDDRRTVTTDTRLAVNGAPHTGTNGERIDFIFDETERFNLVRAIGSFAGELHANANESLGNPARHGEIMRWNSREGVTTDMCLLNLESGTVNQMEFTEITGVQIEDIPRECRESAFVFQPVDTGMNSVLSEYIAAYYAPHDRTHLRGAGVPAPGAAGPRNGGVEAGMITTPYTIHLEIPGRVEEEPIAGIYLSLKTGPLAEDTLLNLRLFDPVRFNRYQVDTEVVLPASEASRVYGIWLAGLDVMVRAGEPLWLALTPNRPVSLYTGVAGSTVALIKGGEVERMRHLREMERHAADIFMSLSEPQPWRVRVEDTNPPLQMLGVRAAFDNYDHILHFDPRNRTAGALKAWSLTRSSRWLPEARAAHPDPLRHLTSEKIEQELTGPRWAALGREALRANAAIVDWWIDNRQDPATGMLGGGLGDDTTFMPWLVNMALISDPDNRYREAIRKLADYTWLESLDRGLNIRMTDHLHAYEEGVNIQHLLPRIYYGEPEYIRRLLLTSQYYDGHLTAVNPQGLRLMRSANFNAETGSPPEGSAWYQPRDLGQCEIFMPGRILTWYNGSPAVTRVLQEWLDSRVLHFANQNAASEAAFFPTGSVDFQTGKLAGRSRMGDFPRHMFWAADVTRDPAFFDKYAGYFQIPARGGSVRHWDEWLMLAAVISPGLLGEDAEERGRQLFRAAQAALPDDLPSAILAVEKYLPVQTYVGQSTDRIRIPQEAMARMFLGGLASIGKRMHYHYHAVSWENADQDIARFVTDKSRRYLKVQLYSYHAEPRTVRMRGWQLEPGRYRIRTGTDQNGDGEMDAETGEWMQDLWRYEAVNLDVPPGETMVVEIQQVDSFSWRLHDLPDLAICGRSPRRENGRLAVDVHNIGGGNAPETVLRLSLDGAVIAQERVPAMAAPLDLEPRVHTVYFDAVEDAGILELVLDPEASIHEITRKNNSLSLQWSAGASSRTLKN